MSNLYRGHSIDASYQFQFIWLRGFQRRKILVNFGTFQTVKAMSILLRCNTTQRDFKWVSELLFNANSAIFQLQCISWREQVNFQWNDDDEVCFVLDQPAELSFYSASSLKQQSAGSHVTPLGRIILIPRQPVFAFSP